MILNYTGQFTFGVTMTRSTIAALALSALTLGGVYMAQGSFAAGSADYAPAPREGDKFVNQKPTEPSSFWRTVEIFWRFMTESRTDPEPENDLPLQALSRAQLEQLSDNQLHIVKLGHSSLLLKVMGEYWLIDPVFSERASPFSFMGPKRFQPTPITIGQLPPIAKVLISHNHYDHLDKKAVAALADKTERFLVPLNVDAALRDWGIAEEKIVAFDWWQEAEDKRARVTFTPTQHFSGRGLGDANETLWGSWVIETAAGKIYFSGDSGYFPGFKTIGERFGPFDLTMIETGAYDKDWAEIHMTPEESVAAHMDLRGKVMMPIHNGTFNLAFHPWYDPLQRVTAEAEQKGASLTTPLVGEILTLGETLPERKWWDTKK